MRRALRSGVAVLTVVLACGLLTGCGGGGGTKAAGIGSLITTSAPTPSATASEPADENTPAPSSTTVTGFKGGGTFVYDHAGVEATMKLPADPTQDDVVNLKTFLRKSHSSALKVASVTVTNSSSKAFTVNGFQLQTTDGVVKLYPVATFVNLAMALPGVAGQPALVSAGSIATLTSTTTIPAGTEMTTLVGTQAQSGTITSIVYGTGSSAVTLEPLYKIKQAAAKLAHEQAQAAKRLARQQAAAARKRARDEQARKHKGGA